MGCWKSKPKEEEEGGERREPASKFIVEGRKSSISIIPQRGSPKLHKDVATTTDDDNKVNKVSSSPEKGSSVVDEGDPVKVLAMSNRAFMGQVYPHVVKKAIEDDGDNNLAFSPYSLQSALAMLLVGAGGRTRRSILAAFGLQDEDERSLLEGFGKVKEDQHSGFSSASKVFAMEGFRLFQSFLDQTGRYFGSTPESLDFTDGRQSSEVINRWAADQTDQKITDIVAPGNFSSMTRIVLVNAIVFKGRWAKPFDVGKTRSGDFAVSKSEAVQSVPELGCRVLALDYEGGEMRMYFFLSDEHEGFDAMEGKIHSFDFSKLNANRRSFRDHRVVIPKFEVQCKLALEEPLKSVGLAEMFDPTSPDFTRMSREGLYVSRTTQRVYVKIDEEGTEAAAVTALQMDCMCADPVFICDRPFLFAIVNPAGLVLFVGRVTNPQKKK